MTICVLPLYQGRGLGSALLQHIIEFARFNFLKTITAHVWSKNEEVIRWYQSRGFRAEKLIKGYYHRMEPRGDAYLMILNLP